MAIKYSKEYEQALMNYYKAWFDIDRNNRIRANETLVQHFIRCFKEFLNKIVTLL